MNKDKMKLEVRKLADLKPAEYNPRIQLKPGDPEFEALCSSIDAVGYVEPIVINADGTIISGHQRCTALKYLGRTEAEVVVLNLDKVQEKAANVALNKIKGQWDREKLADILTDIDLSYLDATVTGFNRSTIDALKEEVGEINTGDAFFERKNRNDTSRQEGNEEYNEFLEKFEPKKTTDDCYTSDLVYDSIADWVAAEYGLDRKNFVRPFYPGGDYEKYKYTAKSVVVDNPPFSIFAEIVKFYLAKGIKFFLFCPGLTPLSGGGAGATIIICGVTILYENGAGVNTSFATNLDESGCILKTAPELYKIVDAACDTLRAQNRRYLTKNLYPDNVVTAALANRYCKYGVDYKVNRKDGIIIDALDEQKAADKAIFGKGVLLSERAAAERAAAERAAAERAAAERAAAETWQLSPREMEIVKSLGE